MDFKKYSENYIQFHTRETLPEFLVTLFNKSASDFSVVDLGCGDGSLLLPLLARYGKNIKRIVGVDLSKERIERLRGRNIPNLELICSDACDVKELQDSSFDYVINSGVIEHVPDDRKLLLEIHRILKQSGTLYVMSVLKKKYAWYFYRCNGKWALDPTHVREYASKNEFISLIESEGFKVAESEVIPVKFIPADFLIRRVYSRIFKVKDINSFFLRHKIFNKLRSIKIPVPGYYIINVVAMKV